jgi:hypothetical protein
VVLVCKSRSGRKAEAVYEHCGRQLQATHMLIGEPDMKRCGPQLPVLVHRNLGVIQYCPHDGKPFNGASMGTDIKRTSR